VSAPPSPVEATVLESCVLHVAAHHGRSMTLGALHDVLVGQNPTGIAAELRRVIAAAEHAGLQAAFGQYALAQTDTGLLPAILLTKTGGAVCVFHGTWPPVPRACGQSFHDIWPPP
jgi:ATP-binding cassette, subfamily C, bacterial LapB